MRWPWIEEYLREVPPDHHDSTLEELVAIELEFGWRHRGRIEGQPPLVERYLTRFPVLAESTRLLRLLQQEFHARHRFGDQPPHTEYQHRFPELFPSVAAAEDMLGRAAPETRAWVVGQQLGRYKLLARHGRGGFGEVWRAFDVELGRDVALKRLSNALAGNPSYRRRFVHEASTTAQLEHPGIVPVHDVRDPVGEPPYYAMRFFAGDTLAAAISAFHQLPHRDKWHSIEQMRLVDHFLSLVRAIAFAHAEGVVHRDLKPQNVVLGQFGETIVLDWGLAKRRDDHLTIAPDADAQADLKPVSQADGAPEVAAAPRGDDDATRDGTVLGTPIYMAPEQAAGQVELIDQRSDVYSLGVILFELLTGTTPDATNALNTHRKTERSDVTDGADRPSPSPRRLRTSIPRAMDAICRRALHSDRQRRYATAGELAADLERLLADEPVSAAVDPWIDRLKRWSRRHRTLVVSVAAVGVAALFGLAAFSVFAVFSNRALAERERQARFHRNLAETSLGEATANLYFHRVLLASSELEQNNVGRAEELLDGCPVELRHWEWHHLKHLCRRGEPRILSPDRGVIRAVAYSPDATRLATIGRDGTVSVWDAATLSLLREFEFGDRPRVVVFGNDGDLLIVGGTIDRRGCVKGWDRAGALVVDFQAHPSAIGSMALSADGRQLATASTDRTVAIWSVGDWRRTHVLAGHEGQVTAVAFSPDGSRVATGGYDKSVRLWDVEQEKLIRVGRGHEDQIHSVAFHPGGRYIASASHDRTIRIWDCEDRQPPRQLVGHSHFVRHVRFHPDGDWLVSASFDRTARLWSFPDGEQLAVLRGHESHLRWLAIRPDGDAIATASEDGTVRLWNLSALKIEPSAGGSILAWEPGSRRIATALKRQVRLLDESGRVVWDIPGRDVEVYELAFSTKDILVVGYGDGAIDLWDVASRTRASQLQYAGGVCLSADFTHLGDRLLTGHADGGIVCWDPRSEQPVWQLRAHPDAVTCVRVRADGRQVASAGKDGIVRLWTHGGEPIAELRGHTATVSRVAFSSRGLIASCGYDGDVCIWSEEGRLLRKLRVGNQWVNCIDFHPDGSRLASGSEEAVKLWDTESWEQVLSLTGHPCIQELQFSGDGRSLALAGTHRRLRIWEGPSPE